MGKPLAKWSEPDFRVDSLIGWLDQHQLSYLRKDHPAVFTCEESAALVSDLPGQRTKNLFLRDRSGKRHFLVAVPPEKSVDLKALAKEIGCSKLSLGSPQRLQDRLGVEPGSVTLLGLVNDPDGQVEVVLDLAITQADRVRCHPLVNTCTLSLEQDSLQRFFELTGHDPSVLEIPQRGTRPAN